MVYINKKMSIKEILEANKHYEIESQKLNKLYKQIKTINSLIDLDEVEKLLTYKEVKDLYKIIQYSIDNEKIEKEFTNSDRTLVTLVMS